MIELEVAPHSEAKCCDESDRYRLAACKSAQPNLLLNHPGGWLIKKSPVSEFLEESKLSVEPKKLFLKL